MGSSESTRQTQDSSKEFSEPWRKLPWGQTKEFEEKLRKFKLKIPNGQHIRILMVGEVGAGKSSFINSVNNVFQHRITSGALVATASGTSFTKVYKTHYIKNEDGSCLPFIFNDIMGLESGAKGANPQDIVGALKGLVTEGYKFDSGSVLAKNQYRTNPGLEDKCFCLVNIVNGSTISLMDQTVIEKMQLIRQAASNLNIPQVIIMTKPDETCPLVQENLQNIYKSKKIKEKMQECSNLLGIPMNHIFPVKNYHQEMDTDDVTDLLILKALDQIVHIASDALEDNCSQQSSPKDMVSTDTPDKNYMVSTGTLDKNEFPEPWREMNWRQTKELEDKLRNFHIDDNKVQYIRILVVGDVGAGKSSFINSVHNAFAHRITSGALVATSSGTSFTVAYKTHYIKGADGSRLPFIFNDIMGLESGEGRGANPEDMIKALKGLVKEGYKFNPASALSEESHDYKTHPALQDQTFCLVNVVDTSKVSIMKQSVIDKMKIIRKAASEMGIPQVVIMTKPDAACPLVNQSLNKIYKSKKIKEKMQECSNLLGIPMNHIFPVKNYHEEVDTKNDIDHLILKAMDQIVHIANDVLENISDINVE